MTLDDVIAYQRQHDLGDVHVVYVGVYGWRCAHTESERIQDRSGGPALSDCALHRWMMMNVHSPNDVLEGMGLYKVTRREHDPTSESFRSDASSYDFERINDGTA